MANIIGAIFLFQWQKKDGHGSAVVFLSLDKEESHPNAAVRGLNKHYRR